MILTLNFNGELHTPKAKGIAKAIMSVKPATLFTDVYVTYDVDGDIRERKLNLTQGKKLFNNEDFLNVFVMNLQLK